MFLWGDKKSSVASGVAFIAVVIVFTLFTLFPGKDGKGRFRLELDGDWDTTLGVCRLPGTTDESRLGTPCTDTLGTLHLSRQYSCFDTVTYTKEIDIPKSMASKRLSLIMERTKPSTLVIDGDTIGHHGHITGRHIYELPALSSGKHRFSITIDNRWSSVPGEVQGSHAWTENTQTNWNGILGDFCIEAADSTCISGCKITTEGHKANVTLTIVSHRACKAELEMTAGCSNSSITVSDSYDLSEGKNEITMTIDLGPEAKLWSEFHPSLYDLSINLKAGKCKDAVKTRFGLRDFRADGTQFSINGFTTFLRGKHDGCIFPLTGYAPTDVETWRRYMSKAREYGINHIRFHSYTPPEAAFEAADEIGMYLQVELPFWGKVNRGNTRLNEFLLREGEMILEQFGSHPSFVMMGLGNELNGDISLMREWVGHLRSLDDSRLYCFGSNNFIGRMGPQEGEDYYVGARLGIKEGMDTDIRGSFAFCDAIAGGRLNAGRPGTQWDYSNALQGFSLPVVSHEVGQYQVFPDFSEINKYTGTLRPTNLKVFKERMKEVYGSDISAELQEASGAWALECYKADMEAAIRTPGMAGFELLDLQDYSGQGTALVGVLDAFMDEKGIPGLRELWTGSCSPLTIVARFQDYCLRTDGRLDISIDIANYLEQDWNEDVTWKITSSSEGADDVVLADGDFSSDAGQGSVTNVGSIDMAIGDLVDAAFCGSMVLTVASGQYRNSYELFVFPAEQENENDIKVFYEDGEEMQEALRNGESVVLIRQDGVGGLFTPDFWNYGMFKKICERNGAPVSPGTLSVRLDHESTFAASFPTAEHTGWQWWSILRNSSPVEMHRGDMAVISVIDNIERSLPLGLLFETPVEAGHLLVCTVDLDAISGTPEGQAFRSAVMKVAEGL